MSIYKNPGAFADPEDSQIVADAKKELQDPTYYTYTEVGTIFRSFVLSRLLSTEGCDPLQLGHWCDGERAPVDL
jgi:hypothetical protein